MGCSEDRGPESRGIPREIEYSAELFISFARGKNASFGKKREEGADLISRAIDLKRLREADILQFAVRDYCNF